MRFLQVFVIVAVGAMTTAASPSAVSYSGNWPVTITHSQHSNGTFCLTLTDYGGSEWRHSGGASLKTGSHTYTGTFQLINHELVTTIEEPGYGQNAGAVFVGHATHGTIGKGFYDQVYGGEAFDTGALDFGMKGGC